MDLMDYREQIDRIDEELLLLFQKRMEISWQIACYKKEHNLPVMDAAREKEKLGDISEKAGEGFDLYAQKLYKTLFEISREYQERAML